MKQAIENGKHILVEKSITLNSDELNEMAELADKNHVIIGEAMTIYHMPIYKKLKEILETGVLGKVNLITMNFGSFKEYDMNNRFFNPDLAGGSNVGYWSICAFIHPLVHGFKTRSVAVAGEIRTHRGR